MSGRGFYFFIFLFSGNRTQVKPTTLIIMDLQTDKVIRQYPIPLDQLKPATTLASVTIDVAKTDCDNAFAYLPDLSML